MQVMASHATVASAMGTATAVRCVASRSAVPYTWRFATQKC